MSRKLTYSSKDEFKLFRRERWLRNGMEDLFFTWSHEKQAYVYVNRHGNNTYKYAKPHHNVNYDYGYSKVGDGVLTADDLEFARIVNKISNEVRKEREVGKNVNYIGGEYKAVSVKYLGERSEYTFKADLDIAVKMKEGTLVVVDSSNGLGLARVVKVYDKDIKDKEAINKYNEAKAWVVNIVDEAAQNARIDSTERKEFILKELAERKEQMQEIAIFEMLAKSDPDAAKLLEELKVLTNTTLEVN